MIELGFKPRTSFDSAPVADLDMDPAERIARRNARDRAQRMEDIWKKARESLEVSQAR